jgi:hypothetical protein
LCFFIGAIGVVNVENEIRKVKVVSWRQVEQDRDGWREQLCSSLSFLGSGTTEEQEEEQEEEEEKEKGGEDRNCILRASRSKNLYTCD